MVYNNTTVDAKGGGHMPDIEIIKAVPAKLTNNEGIHKSVKRVAAYCRVSTNKEEQASSYQTQVEYYTNYINSNPEWEMAGIYADEGITGVSTDKRDAFNRMISDCKCGKINIIITKSISRFARNTVDVLKYVRLLRDSHIAVIFEEENIDTLTMDGELLLTILSSVYQQEVENLSEHVKKGLRMRVMNGKVVGFSGCFGYDYDPKENTITVNEEEAKYVRYIFRRYCEGAGSLVISHELEDMGVVTRRGSKKWASSSVLLIIKNEIYMGDMRCGKTFSVSPMSKRRLVNKGEEDQVYIKDHHDPIISREVFEKAKAIRKSREGHGLSNMLCSEESGRRYGYKKYAFTGKIKCRFCGQTYTRRTMHAKSERYKRIYWACYGAIKSLRSCHESRSVQEKAIEKAFVQSFNLMVDNNADALKALIDLFEEKFEKKNYAKELAKWEKEVKKLKAKKDKLIDLRLEGGIDKESYDNKYAALEYQVNAAIEEKAKYAELSNAKDETKNRIESFKKVLSKDSVMKEFDPAVFESTVEKVIIGDYDDNGNPKANVITFVYKTGVDDKKNLIDFKTKRRNAKEDNETEHSRDPEKLSLNMAVEDEGLLPNQAVNEAGI